MANIDKLNIAGTNYNVQDTVSGYIPRGNYAEITIAVADINTTTLACTKTLSGATSASHPLVGCLTTSAASRDDQLEAFNCLLYAETGSGNITFYFSELPSISFTVQVVGY